MTSTSTIHVVPNPSSVEVREGTFEFSPSTVLAAGIGTEPEARLFAQQVEPAMGFTLKVDASPTTPPKENVFLLQLDPEAAGLGDEGYRLEISREQMLLSAYRPAGLFYGCQTIRQLLPPEAMAKDASAGVSWSVPCAVIEDKPRFPWRGHLLDTSRHFFTVDEVKRAIDLAAFHKLNIFHWHLVDDQGWRLEIKRYPELTATGSSREDENGGRYGGMYSQDEVREIVAYAAARHVTVVPEIEMPGHSSAVLASYPDLGCTGGPYKVWPVRGISKDVYCAGREQTYRFIYNVLDEVLALFPSQYIHIGGDECPKDRWSSCTHCQARIKAENLKDEHELQSFFVRRIDKYLSDRGRRLIGWDEILEGGLAPGAVVQAWRDANHARAAVLENHDVILSPITHCYLDYTYEQISVEKAYSYEPVPEGLTADQANRVLGIEGNTWAELVPNTARYDEQTYPRMSALAEVAWTEPNRKDWADFSSRFQSLKRRLDILGVKYGGPDSITPAQPGTVLPAQ